MCKAWRNFGFLVSLFYGGLYINAQTQLNPITQVNWTQASGVSSPTSGCPYTTTASTVSGSSTIVVASTSGLLVNQTVTGTGIPSNTIVSLINTTTLTVTLNHNATATGTGVTVNFYPLGRPYYDISGGVGYFCTFAGWVNTGGSTAANITIGSTTVTSGTNGSLLFDNAGILGNESLASLLVSPPAIGTGTYNDAFFSHLQAYTTLSAASFNTATSGSNTQSAPFHMTADYWTGSGSTPDDWEMQNVPAAGTNPPDTLVISHTGASVANIEITEPVVIAQSGGAAGNITFGQGTAPSFVSGNGYIFSDASGNMMSNDNATGSGNICNTVNGHCQPPTTFKTSGVNNSSQTTLNLVAGTNVTLTNTSGGNVTIAASGGGGSYPTPVTLTASNSSELDFTTCIDTHRDYELRFSDLVGSATITNIYVQFSTNGGATYDTTSGHYVWGEMYVGVNASTGLTGSPQNNDIGFLVGGFGATTPSTVDGFMRIYNLPNSTSYKSGNSLITVQNGPTFSSSNVQTIGDLYTQTAAVNALRIIPASGTLVSGTVTCQPIPQ